MIYIFTGNGKGKTTAAIGVGIRAVGAGRSVLMVQFMKVKEISSEYRVLDRLKGFTLVSFGRKGFFLPEEELNKNPELLEKGFKPFTKIDFQLAEEGVEYVKNSLLAEEHQLYILDELCVALHYKLIEKTLVESMLEEYKDRADFVITGRYCPDWLCSKADLITEMKDIKHPFSKGEYGRKGIDF
ncbi:cob(I)yrinic acid a,c-diamide adenosyltransferase [Persephonella sp.]